MGSVTVSHLTQIVKGCVNVPSSKSVSNRQLLLRTIFNMDHRPIFFLSEARDTQILKTILENKNAKEINVHDAGTAARFLTAYFSCVEGERIITGTLRMQQRPIGALVAALQKLGADIEYVQHENFLPIKIRGKKLAGGKIEVDGSISSQFLSALLLITPLMDKPLELHIANQPVSASYVEMTLKMMQQWGIACTKNNNTVWVDNKKSSMHFPMGDIVSEGDWSAASYFYSIMALAKEGEIRINRLNKNSLQGDSVCAALFQSLGVHTRFYEDHLLLTKNKHSASSFLYNCISCPDLAPTLAFCGGGKNINMTLQGLQTLSGKETDRVRALQQELHKMQISSSYQNHSLSFQAHNTSLPAATFESYNDHRMAMGAAPLALCLPSVSINNPEVVEKSFPHFWEELKKIGFLISKSL
ncbi:MAG: 3-phosphoshikimate 1-carboxyvinyltransferase [Bacteroidetes bacterium]|nr:3-phosphoshikimate 1-carboxyvinyltransferase [Bacteroidota bacterium]